MGILYVAVSKSLQDWGADVGLGKLIYKVGYVDEGAPADVVMGMAGAQDWKILLSLEAETDEKTILERLAVKEKIVDPNYYPRLKGATGIVKVTLAAVENSMLVAIALENQDAPKNFKVKPADIAQYLIRNLLK